MEKEAEQAVRGEGILYNILNFSYTLKKELFRKTIHMMSAFVPFFYFFSNALVMILLLLVTLFYFLSEILRIRKIRIPLITRMTEIASRTRDEGKIVLGPITLSMGIFLALTLFDYRVAVLAIFALSFGDGVASLFGKIIGGIRIPFTLGKTISGSAGCFIVLSIVFYSCGLQPSQALLLAAVSALIEVFPTGDFDNLIIPVAVGVFATRMII
jgi:dolichol kinase